MVSQGFHPMESSLCLLPYRIQDKGSLKPEPMQRLSSSTGLPKPRLPPWEYPRTREAVLLILRAVGWPWVGTLPTCTPVRS